VFFPPPFPEIEVWNRPGRTPHRHPTLVAFLQAVPLNDLTRNKWSFWCSFFFSCFRLFFFVPLPPMVPFSSFRKLLIRMIYRAHINPPLFSLYFPPAGASLLTRPFTLPSYGLGLVPSHASLFDSLMNGRYPAWLWRTSIMFSSSLFLMRFPLSPCAPPRFSPNPSIYHRLSLQPPLGRPYLIRIVPTFLLLFSFLSLSSPFLYLQNHLPPPSSKAFRGLTITSRRPAAGFDDFGQPPTPSEVRPPLPPPPRSQVSLSLFLTRLLLLSLFASLWKFGFFFRRAKAAALRM